MENDLSSPSRVGTVATTALTTVAPSTQVMSGENHCGSFPVVVDILNQRKLKSVVSDNGLWPRKQFRVEQMREQLGALHDAWSWPRKVGVRVYGINAVILHGRQAGPTGICKELC